MLLKQKTKHLWTFIIQVTFISSFYNQYY